jgi:hypothetical protein
VTGRRRRARGELTDELRLVESEVALLALPLRELADEVGASVELHLEVLFLGVFREQLLAELGLRRVAVDGFEYEETTAVRALRVAEPDVEPDHFHRRPLWPATAADAWS